MSIGRGAKLSSASRQRGRVCAAFRTGMTTDTLGMVYLPVDSSAYKDSSGLRQLVQS